MKNKMPDQSHQDVSTGCDREHKAQIRPTEQGKIRQNPDYENQYPSDRGGIRKCTQVIHWRERNNSTDLVHPMAQEGIPQHIGDDHECNQDLGLSAMKTGFRIHAGFIYGDKIRHGNRQTTPYRRVDRWRVVNF